MDDFMQIIKRVLLKKCASWRKYSTYPEETIAKIERFANELE